MSDVSGVVARLYVYPIKSCSGTEVQESVLTATGLAMDRAFMLVDADGNFLTQRELPRMALIQPLLSNADLALNAPGIEPLRISLASGELSMRVKIWADLVAARDMGEAAAKWFSRFLGQPARLVHFDEKHRRLSNMHWTGGIEAPNRFSDGYPLLVIGESSLDLFNRRMLSAGYAAVGMDRFRPNIVIAGLEPHDEDRVDAFRIASGGDEILLKPVKPCSRCPIPNINPTTATSTPEVGDILQTYRTDPRVDGAITFGMNAIVLQGENATLRLGQAVHADFQFD